MYQGYGVTYVTVPVVGESLISAAFLSLPRLDGSFVKNGGVSQHSKKAIAIVYKHTYIHMYIYIYRIIYVYMVKNSDRYCDIDIDIVI